MSEQDGLADPFKLLLDIEHRSRTQGGASPAQEEMERFWTGVAFVLAGTRYITPLNEVSEIMARPPYTKIPGVKNWMRGIANVRGTLLPIMDLNGFLGFGNKHSQKSQRILVVNHRQMISGLIVDEVLGLQHFEEHEGVTETFKVDEVVKPYITGAFDRDGERWIVFSLHKLAAHSSFMQVAQ